jgi:hypothetical protein
MLGTCDSKTSVWPTYGKDLRVDVQALVDTFSSMPSNPTIYIVLPPYVLAKNSINAQNKVIEEEIIPVLKEVADKNGLSIIDGHTPTSSPDYFPDGVHPNSKGYEILADVFYKSLTADATNLKHASNSNTRSYRTIIRIMTFNKTGLTDYTTGGNILFEKRNGTGIEENKYYLLNGKQLFTKKLLSSD